MEPLIVVLILAAVLLPPATFFISLSARKRAKDLEWRLESLERTFDNWRRRQEAAKTPESSVEEKPAPAYTPSPPLGSAPAPAPAVGVPVPPPPMAPAEPGAVPPPVLEPVLARKREVAESLKPPLEPAEAAPSLSSAAAAAEPPQGMKRPGIDLLRLDKFNWEQFMGVRMFAWLGGLALFLAAAFFVKYSFDHDLIPPEVRVAIGFLTGMGLLAGGMVLSRKPYKVTAHTLCATGVVILYAVTFACRAVYKFPFFGPIPTFLLMTMITTVAFLIAVRLNAQVVAVLGMLGGFLTPLLLSTGHDNPAGLFGYIALLDVGLILVASARRWDWLNLASAAGTILMEIGWAIQFFEPPKVFIAMAVFLGFDALYLAALVWACRKGKASPWLSAAAAGLPLVTMGFIFYLLTYDEMGTRPGVLASFLFGADVCLAAAAIPDRRLRKGHLLGGGAAFIILSTWTLRFMTPALLPWGLVLYLGYAVLHSLFPVALQRRFPGEAHASWGHLFPVLALVQVLLPILKIETISFLVWPVILLVDLLAIGVALLTASMAGVVLALVATCVVGFVWMGLIPAAVGQVPFILIVVGGFAVVFGAAGLFLARRIPAIAEATGVKSQAAWTWTQALDSARMRDQIPALSAILPFLLLVMAVGRMPMANPSAVFGMALLLLAMLLALAKLARMEWLPPIGLGCAFLVQNVWHARHFDAAYAALALGWHLVFFLTVALFPFLFLRGQGERVLSWISSALSGPAHFLLIYALATKAWPNNMMGMIPALFAIPSLGGLILALRQIPREHPKRNTILAWFGGVALLFITLIFPIQFERHWLTLAWALEGVALLWLYFRVPHRGLRVVGIALLAAAFARLALNPAVLSYHPRAPVAIFNWYLYTYGLASACMFAAARLLPPPDHLVLKRNPLPLLYGMGVLLAFLLLNIEIADYFSAPGTRTLTFKFSGSFARDMTYTIAWSLFALGLLIAGILKRLKAARYAGIGLQGVALLKLFFHDLARLDQLYRVGALVGVAVVAIVASFLYQKFLSHDTQ